MLCKTNKYGYGREIKKVGSIKRRIGYNDYQGSKIQESRKWVDADSKCANGQYK